MGEHGDEREVKEHVRVHVRVCARGRVEVCAGAFEVCSAAWCMFRKRVSMATSADWTAFALLISVPAGRHSKHCKGSRGLVQS